MVAVTEFSQVIIHNRLVALAECEVLDKNFEDFVVKDKDKTCKLVLEDKDFPC